jgi:hypothetical protein
VDLPTLALGLELGTGLPLLTPVTVFPTLAPLLAFGSLTLVFSKLTKNFKLQDAPELLPTRIMLPVVAPALIATVMELTVPVVLPVFIVELPQPLKSETFVS